MGGRIARRIRDAGLSISGFDVNGETAAGSGLPVAESVANLVGGSDAVFLSLPDSRVVEAIVYDDDGVLDSVGEGVVVVDLSTADPDLTRRIHADLAGKGADFVDAGISGGAAAAEKGSLTIMAGGSAEAVERVKPVFGLTASTG